MRKQAILVGAATVVVSIGVALAENQAPQQYDKSAAPSGVQSTTPDHPPIVTLPEANAPDPDATGAPILETTGQAATFEDLGLRKAACRTCRRMLHCQTPPRPHRKRLVKLLACRQKHRLRKSSMSHPGAPHIPQTHDVRWETWHARISIACALCRECCTRGIARAPLLNRQQPCRNTLFGA